MIVLSFFIFCIFIERNQLNAGAEIRTQEPTKGVGFFSLS